MKRACLENENAPLVQCRGREIVDIERESSSRERKREEAMWKAMGGEDIELSARGHSFSGFGFGFGFGFGTPERLGKGCVL